jgi:mono/diheme cytochrome c family protein
MKALAWSCAVVASCALLVTAWVWGASPGADDRDDGRAAASPPGAGANARPPGTIQNLSDADRALLFHRPEGIELVPLPWIKALKSIKTNQPFLEFPERFGLLPDPEDPDHLPIGITASATRGGELFGRMVGVNCAACHVGAVTRGAATFPLLGAPNLFDLNAFYQELFASLGVMLKDEGTRLQFMRDLANQGDAEFAILTQQLLAAAAVAGQLGGAALKDTARLFQTRLIEVIKKVVAESEAQARQAGHPPDAASIAALRSAVQAQVGRLSEKDALGLVALVLSSDAPDDPVDAALKADPDPVLAGVLRQLDVELSLLRARIRFIASLRALHEAQRPLPGPGRIDAFGGIRDLVFPRSDAIAADSPVSYPELWLVNQTYWLHWDGNTNSVIERNIGQALGQGAPFEAVGQGDYHSLVQPVNIHQLENTVRKLSPPDWPVPLFGPIDQAKAARGKAIYEDRCVKCHKLARRDGHAILDAILAAQKWAAQPAGRRGPSPVLPPLLEKLVPAEEVGTDPARAMNFATNVGRQKPLYTGGTDFAAALGEAAWKYSLTSYKDNDVPPGLQAQFDWPRNLVHWRTTRGYVARPLVSAWATAPYLHNASVPTIYHLLLPAKDRPKLFPVGQREYDPVKLGYVIDPTKIPAAQVPLLFEFNTTAGGNSNAGHEGHAYGTDLADDQRYDLLEFLKTL